MSSALELQPIFLSKEDTILFTGAVAKLRHMTRALEQAGFEVTGQHWDPSALHAVVTARADSGR